MKIKTKLTLVFFFVALPIIAAGAIVYYNLQLISKSFNEVTNGATPAILFLNDVKTNFLDGANDALGFAISGDNQKKADYENDMQSFHAQTQRLTDIVNFDSSLSPQEKSDLSAKINSTHEDFMQAVQTLFSLTHEERDSSAGEQAVTSLTEKISAFLPNINALIDVKRREIVQNQDAVEQNILRTLEITIFFTIFCLLVSLWANGWIFQGVAGPLTVFRNKARAIASGSLAEKVDIRTDNEFGELAAAFNEMAGKSYEAQTAMSKMMAAQINQCEIDKNTLERKVEEEDMELKKIRLRRQKNEFKKKQDTPQINEETAV